MTDARYRTLILVEIEQLTGLAVGAGSGSLESDTVFRDGLGNLTIPGSSIAGALVEAVARTGNSKDSRPLEAQSTIDPFVAGRLISGKKRGRLTKGGSDDSSIVQSLWTIEHAHISSDYRNKVLVQLRQGVGIRHTTGAAATENKALFDGEFVPAGTRWNFVIDIDTNRGGAAIEQSALLALRQLHQGEICLGRNAARGMGRVRITDRARLVRIPLSAKGVRLWPNNEIDWRHDWNRVNRTLALWKGSGIEPRELIAEIQEAASVSVESSKQNAINNPVDFTEKTFCYLHLDWELQVGEGPRPSGTAESYGWDSLHVGGHPFVSLTGKPLDYSDSHSGIGTDNEQLVAQDNDHPFVSMLPVGDRSIDKTDWEPYLPGSGLRGPLRHAASRLWRSLGVTIPDPMEGKQKRESPVSNSESIATKTEQTETVDQITQLFGSLSQSGRLSLGDARLVVKNKKAKDSYRVIKLDHVAIDEFTGGVFGSGKFDRDVLIDGSFQFQLTLEASSVHELIHDWRTLLPAFQLALLGYVPIGGSKFRGSGWVPWQCKKIEFTNALGVSNSVADPKLEQVEELLMAKMMNGGVA